MLLLILVVVFDVNVIVLFANLPDVVDVVIELVSGAEVVEPMERVEEMKSVSIETEKSASVVKGSGSMTVLLAMAMMVVEIPVTG